MVTARKQKLMKMSRKRNRLSSLMMKMIQTSMIRNKSKSRSYPRKRRSKKFKKPWMPVRIQNLNKPLLRNNVRKLKKAQTMVSLETLTCSGTTFYRSWM